MFNVRVGADGTSVDGATFWVIAPEITRVDDESANAPREPQPDEAPVEAGRPASARLPPVHPLAAFRVLALDEDGGAGLKQILLRGEELVVGVHDRPPEPFGCETRS